MTGMPHAPRFATERGNDDHSDQTKPPDRPDVPTLITGYFGMNVPYPGFSQTDGFAASVATIVLAVLILYLIFKRNDWL